MHRPLRTVIHLLILFGLLFGLFPAPTPVAAREQSAFSLRALERYQRYLSERERTAEANRRIPTDPGALAPSTAPPQADAAYQLFLPVLHRQGTQGATYIGSAGGMVRADNDRVIVTFPPGALPDGAWVTFSAPDAALPALPHSETIRQLDLRDDGGNPIMQTAAPFTLSVQAMAAQVQSAETTYRIAVYNSVAGAWQVLPTTLDAENGMYRAALQTPGAFGLLQSGSSVTLTQASVVGGRLQVGFSSATLNPKIHVSLPSGAIVTAPPTVGNPNLFDVPVSGSGILSFHISDSSNVVLPFAGFALNGAYSYRVATNVPNQPLWVGQGAASPNQFRDFLTKYLKLTGPAVPGAATDLIGTWGGFVVQRFAAPPGGGSSVLIQNPDRCFNIYQVRGDVLSAYTSAGGPAGSLGPPISDETTALSKHPQIVDEPLGQFKSGIITRTGSTFSAQDYYPELGPATLTVSTNPVSGDLIGTITVQTSSVPGKPALTRPLTISATPTAGVFNLSSPDSYTGALTTPLIAGQPLTLMLKAQRDDGRIVEQTYTFTVPATGPITSGAALPLDPSTVTSNPAQCASLPIPADTTPPVIVSHAVVQDGRGGVLFTMKVTDDRRVAKVTVTLDGMTYNAISKGNDQYEAIVNSVALGEHSYTINAVDTAGNTAVPVSGTFKLERSDSYGIVASQGYSQDPVNTLIGNFIYNYADLSIVEPGPDLVIDRFYNGQSTFVGLFGMGWTTLFDMTVFTMDNSLFKGAIVRYADGRTANFPATGAGGFDRPVDTDIFDHLTSIPSGFLLVAADQIRYQFDGAGRLVEIRDLSGNWLRATYTGGRLNTFTTSSGTTVNVTTNSTGRVTQLDAPLGISLNYTYDSAGRLMTMRDGNGHTVTYHYDAKNGMKRIESPEGYDFLDDQTFDSQGRVLYQLIGGTFVNAFKYDPNRTIITDAYGYTTTHIYDSDGRLIEVIDAQPSSELYEYNTNDQRTKFTDRNGKVTTYTYDPAGNLIGETDANGNSSTWMYDAQRRKTSATDERGFTITYTYDPQGRLTAIVNPLSERTEMRYNSAGQIIEQISPRGARTTYRYDARGLLVEMRDDRGAVTSYIYDALGRRIGETDPNGNRYRFIFDANGNLLEEIDPLGGVTRYRYDRNNNRVSVTDANGATTTYTYTRLGKLHTTTHPDGGVETLTYDNMGNRIGYTDQVGNATNWTLDNVYREIAVTDALGATTTFTYDAVGNRTSVTDPRGFTTRYEYDALNRIEQVIDPFGGITRFSYDDADNLLTQTDPLGAVTTHAYNELNQLEQHTDPNGAVTEYVYDGHGNRIKITDSLGNITEREYDAQNRLIRETDPLGRTTRYTYDPNGNRVMVEDARGFQERSSYDALNRLISTIDALGHETRYRYDAVGNRVAEIDALGATIRLSYDSMRRMVERVDPLGNVTRVEYDLTGRPIRATDANGHSIVSRYDAAGRLLSETDQLGLSERYSYDAAGNRVEVIDRTGARTRFEYDALNRIVAQTDGRGSVTRFRYDLAGNEIARIDARGQTTRYAYDAAGRLTETVDALGNVTRTTYDALGRTIGLLRPDGATIAQRYDAAGQLIAVIDGAGLTTRYSYDETGNRLTTTAPGGQTVTTSYDAMGRPLEVRDDIGVRQRISYDAVGNRIAETDGSGLSTTYSYDAARRLVDVRDPAGRTTTLRYDAVGNRIAVEGPDGATTQFSYDRRNQLVRETDPNGNTVQYAYDGAGRRIAMIDALGVTTRWEYDAVGNLTAVTLNAVADAQPNHEVNVTTRFSYDAVGNRTAITNPNGHTTTFTPDPLGRLSAEVDPLGQRTEYVYDALGREVERREPNGRIVLSTYDRADRLIETHYVAEGERVQRAYDDRGLLIELTDVGGTTRFTYDERGRLTAEQTPRGNVQYRYDAADRRSELIYPDGAELAYRYNQFGDLEQIITPDGAVTSLTRDTAGRVIRQVNGNGVITEHSYDPAGNLLETATRRNGANDALISRVAYTYNAIHQRSVAVYTDSQGQVTREEYRQDSLRRLVEVRTNAGLRVGYAYDAAGNRTAWTTNDDPRTPIANDGISLRFQYDAADQLTELSGSGTTVQYRYDASGNRIERLTDGRRTRYSFDSANRLIAVLEQQAQGSAWRDTNLVTMERDGLGRRITQQIDNLGDTAAPYGRNYLHAGLEVIDSFAIGADADQRFFRTEEGRLLAQQRAEDANAYFTQDALGSTLALSDGDGRAIADYRYDSYGIPMAGGEASLFTYTGQEYDAAIGLYHFHARAYDPETATWLSRDPYRGNPTDPQSLHRYGYVQGNPINLWDAYGYMAQSGTYAKSSGAVELPGFIKLLMELSKTSGKKWERKIEGPKPPDDWPLPGAVKDSVTKFLPRIEAGAEVSYGFSDSRKFETYISGNTIAVGEKICRKLEASAYAYVKADLWKGSLWVIEASAGLGAGLGLEGQAEGCLAVQFGASFDTPHVIANAGIEVDASLKLVGELKAYVRLSADVFVARIEGEAGIKATVSYPLLACEWEAKFGSQLPSAESDGCPAPTGDIELGVGVYADINWGGVALNDGWVSYEATLATAWIRDVPTLAKLIGWAQ